MSVWTVLISSRGRIYPEALGSVVTNSNKLRREEGLLLQVLCVWKHTKISREGFTDCFHSSSLLSALRYNWWIDGGDAPGDVIFVLVIWTVFMSPSPLWSTDHDSWPRKLDTGCPSSPARVMLTDGISIMYPAPSPHCHHCPQSNELLWLRVSGGQKPIVACQAYSGWGWAASCSGADTC